MSGHRAVRGQKNRELRRRVMLRARMRAGSSWTDACILNVSSRGMMINAPNAANGLMDSLIEVHHGDHVIVAQVVWSKGTRAGLRSQHPVPVDDILALCSAASLQLTAAKWPQVDRRKRVRSSDENRARGRAMEFVGITILAMSLGLGALSLVEQSFSYSMQAVSAALGS